MNFMVSCRLAASPRIGGGGGGSCGSCATAHPIDASASVVIKNAFIHFYPSSLEREPGGPGRNPGPRARRHAASRYGVSDPCPALLAAARFHKEPMKDYYCFV